MTKVTDSVETTPRDEPAQIRLSHDLVREISARAHLERAEAVRALLRRIAQFGRSRLTAPRTGRRHECEAC